VQIVADRDLRARGEHLAHAPEDHRLGRLVEPVDLHRAVQREVHAVERAGRADALDEAVEDRIEAAAFEGPAGHGHRRLEWHRLHAARERRSLVEASELGVRHERSELGATQARRLRELVAREVVQALEVFHRGEER
jgi:hypothetical protein